jgi:enterochelin esterase-like enzyme
VRAMVGSLRLDDPELRYESVRLCSDLPLDERQFVRENGSWVLDLDDRRVDRLEYQLELSTVDGNTEVVCDPSNPLRAPGPFGEKSVVFSPTYRAPAWLDEEGIDGAFAEVKVRVLGHDQAVAVWEPSGTDGHALPLLLAHDGPEYDELASLTHYASVIIGRGSVAPFRVALLPPGDRDEWYSASAVYGRSLVSRILPALRSAFVVEGRAVGMGASLGGLAMLQAQRTWPGTLAGLFMQSGSFFMPRFDRHEARFPRYARIVRFVNGVLRRAIVAQPVPAVLTCGIAEENLRNNRVMAAALIDQGYAGRLHEVPDLHNYTSWRDALDPFLTDLLARLWPAR